MEQEKEIITLKELAAFSPDDNIRLKSCEKKRANET